MDKNMTLPDGWGRVRLGDVGTPYSGLSGKNKRHFGAGKPYLPYLNIYQNSKVNPEDLDYVRVEDGEKQKRVSKGDVFFTISSETQDEVGMSAVLLDDLGECYLNSFCFGWHLSSNDLLPEYLRFYFRSGIFRSQIYKLSQGVTRFNLSKNELMKTYILYPSIREQKTIADILQTWDTAIEKTEALIAAKEKQFDWLKYKFFLSNPKATPRQSKPLGEYIEEKQTRSTISDMYLCLTSSRHGMFLQGEYFSKQVASKDNTGYKIMERGDFTFRSMSDDGIFVFNQQTIVDMGLISPAYSVFAPKSNVNEDYLYYFLNSPTFRRTLIKEAQGGTRTALKLNALKKLNIDIPELGEQKSIANKLNFAKREIDTLKTLADRYRTQKRGLMQKLLTGKWRVGL